MANRSGCPPVGIQLEGPVLSPIITLDVIFGLIGNSVALWIFCFRFKTWNPNTIFLFNLVIADFMALVSLPLRIDALIRSYWSFGDGLCRINLFLMFSNRSASIALMTVVATYRYIKVVHPHSRLARLSRRHAFYVLAVVWTLVMAPRMPLLTCSHIKHINNNTQCFFFAAYGQSSAFLYGLVLSHRVITVLEFLGPFFVLVFCCVRISMVLRNQTMGRPEKMRRAMHVCVVVVVMFVVCFLPTSLSTVGIWVITTFRPQDCAAFYTFTQLTIISFGLNFLNSALDPVLYVFSSSVFRRELVKCLPDWVKCSRKEPNPDQSETGTSESQSTTQVDFKFVKAESEL